MIAFNINVSMLNHCAEGTPLVPHEASLGADANPSDHHVRFLAVFFSLTPGPRAPESKDRSIDERARGPRHFVKCSCSRPETLSLDQSLPRISRAPCSNISLRSHTELAVEFTH